jgi:hypothetical protein
VDAFIFIRLAVTTKLARKQMAQNDRKKVRKKERKKERNFVCEQRQDLREVN